MDGSIPDDWKVVRASDLCRLQRGFDITEATRVAGSVPVYSSSGISYFHARAAVQPPAVVTGRKGLLGRVFYVDEPFWPHDTTLWADDFNGNDPRFVAAMLAAFRLERLDAATSVPTLNRNNLAAYEVMVPSRRVEQTKIAAVMWEADTLVEALAKLIAKKRDVKQGMTQELLTGRTRLPGFTGDWREVELGELGVFLKGRGINRDQVRSSGVPCIRYGELYTAYRNYARKTVSFVDPHVAMSALPIRSGDLLFAGSGETKAEIGMTVAYVGEPAAVAGGDIIVLRGTGFDPVFVGSLLNTPLLAAQKASRGQGDAVVHVSAGALSALRFRLPAIGEQREIAEILLDADAEIEALERRLESARAVKVGMMQELLTGRTRLPVKEVA